MNTTSTKTMTWILALAIAGVFGVAGADEATQGYLYGTVETASGKTYTGLLRWGTEEAFWDDLFNSAKTDLPHVEEFGGQQKRKSEIKVLGITIGYRWEDAESSRVFIARFGDIAEIRTGRGERVDVEMRDGTIYELDGGSNDIGGKVTVIDDSLGEVSLEWDRIERVTFAATPSGVRPEAWRLYGELTTRDDRFEGFIQWDSQESLSTDKLDGESEDGDMSIEMGKIRSIEKRNSRGAWVELKDGRKLLLEGTNDVDDSIRGIWVEDARLGRVEVSWEEFERLDLHEPGPSGRGYGDFGSSGLLKGTVTDGDGAKSAGRIVFDLDETSGWEMLNGSRDGVEYNVPFRLVRSIEPRGDDGSLVVLRNGTELLLYDGQDVSDRNDGVVVTRDGGRDTYVPWSDVRRIDFE